MFALVGYPTYQYLGQQSQSLETEKERLAYDPQGTLFCKKCVAVTTAKQGNGEDVNVKNFIVEAKFNNPDDAEINKWLYGFSFRETTNIGNPERHVYTLTFTSDKTWELYLDEKLLQTGDLQNFNVSNIGSNKLVLKVNGERGKLYVNNQPINDELKLENVISGKVYLVSKVLSDKSVKYENFTVWSIRN